MHYCLGPIGIENSLFAVEKGVKVYPNPSKQVTVFNFQFNVREQYFLNLYNILGELIYKQTLTEKQETINIAKSAGIYFYRISNKNGIFDSGKIVIK